MGHLQNLMEDFSPVNKELQSFQKRLAGAIPGVFAMRGAWGVGRDARCVMCDDFQPYSPTGDCVGTVNTVC